MTEKKRFDMSNLLHPSKTKVIRIPKTLWDKTKELKQKIEKSDSEIRNLVICLADNTFAGYLLARGLKLVEKEELKK